MHRVAAIVALSALLGNAPLQCSSDPDPAKALEETPGEAVYKLAQQFQAQGDREAWAATLRFLIENYPSSRFAEMAKLDLEGAAGGKVNGSPAGAGAPPQPPEAEPR